jgi:DnaK suppressor protein
MAKSKRKPAASAGKRAAKKTLAIKKKAQSNKPALRKPASAAQVKVRRGAKGKPIRATKRAAAAKPTSSRKTKPTRSRQSTPRAKTPAVVATKPKTASREVGKAIAVSHKNDQDQITRDNGRYALPSTVVVTLPPNYRPSPREEYMNPRQLAYFRAKLLRWRDDLVEESKQTIDNLREEVRDVGDEAERATRETENSLELRTRDRYRKLIAKIDKALKRIEEGRYGYCEETDEEIGLERLEARPIATLCLDAQERWEHRQKQMGD